MVEQERAIGLGHGRPPCDGAPNNQNRAASQTYLPFNRPCAAGATTIAGGDWRLPSQAVDRETVRERVHRQLAR